MHKAYILDTDKSNDEYITWKYVNNPNEIIYSPVESTYFMDPEDTIQNIIQKIENDYPPQNPLYKKYKVLFGKRVYQIGNGIKLFLKEYLSVGSYQLRNQQVMEQFIYFIKEIKVTKCHVHTLSKDNRITLNNAGIFIRSTRRELEHNPKRAAIQLRQSQAKNKRKQKNIFSNDFNRLFTDLQSLIANKANLTIRFNICSQKYAGVKYIDKMIVFIDLFNLFFSDNSYRKLKSFQTILSTWIKLDNNGKKKYNKKFVAFMNKEAKIKMSRQALNCYST